MPSCTCAYHGACGAGLGVGVFFSILYDATCAKDVERTISMRAANAALCAIANTDGPGCCKQSVRSRKRCWIKSRARESGFTRWKSMPLKRDCTTIKLFWVTVI
ncbi:MAG: DUF5714 domain-containing protein [Bacillota bacterium]|nr:DUF5714 domain-containing protein [Desulforamulus profundi]